MESENKPVEPVEPVKFKTPGQTIPICIFRKRDHLSEEERNPPPPVGFLQRIKRKLLAFIGFPSFD